MAEMHPILWARCTDRKLSDPKRVKITVLSTYVHRTCDIADDVIIFKPSTDLAIWNYIARSIVYDHPDAIDWDFVKEYTVFTAGFPDIGYGMRNPKHAKELGYSSKELQTIKHQAAKELTDAERESLKPFGYGNTKVLQMKHAKAAGKHWVISFEEFKN